jgi:histidinol-phosphatase (PHP family)
MQRSWALELGLPAIAFTEHIDYTVWTGPWTPSALTNSHLASVGFFGWVLTPSMFDAAGTWRL